MTDQRVIDRLLDAFLTEGANEVADRVIVDALDTIDHTRQRRALRLPWRLPTMPMFARVVAAAVIGVLAIGGALYLMQPDLSGIGAPGATPAASASPATPSAAPSPTLTPKPDPTALTGPLGAGRQIHTATVLSDGRVIVAGGLDVGDLPLASVTLYDPATGTFSPTGSMGSARAFFTTTLLADGRVLVVGGGPAQWSHPGPNEATAELFDPETGTFSPTGSMGIPRQGHTATLLRDGRVLIAGGTDAGDHAIATAELYDPKTGTFSPTGSMATARSFHAATVLPDGRILITGGSPAGWSSTSAITASAEIYDPQTGTFAPTGSLGVSRAWHTATLRADGRVLVTGGQTSDGSELATAELFDPATGTFSPTGSMSTPRVYASATLLTDGRVLVAGGGGDYADREFLASAEVYDPTTGTFSATGSMAEARTYHGASLLPDGRVLVTGGYGDLAPLASAEIYDPASGTFSPAGSGG